MSDVQAREWDSPPASVISNGNGHYVPDEPVAEPVTLVQPVPAPAAVVEAPVPPAPEPVAANDEPAVPADPRREQFFAGAGVRFKGDLEVSDELLLSGTFEGTARARRLFVSREGVFNGACLVDEAEIEGIAEGTLTVTGALIVRSGGVVRGKISYGEIELARGAHLEGEVVKKRPDAETPAAAEEPVAQAPVAAPHGAYEADTPVELSVADIVVVPHATPLAPEADARRRFGIFGARR